MEQTSDKKLKRGLLKEVNLILNEFESLSKNKKLDLSVPEQIQYLSSKIDSYFFYPWRGPPLLPSQDTQEMFEDPDMPLKISEFQSSIFKSWELPPIALGNDPVMGTSGAEDLSQDSLDDCSVVASLLSIYQLQKRTNKNILLKNLYPQDTTGQPVVSPCGIYCIKLFINGIERMVTIDSRLPTSNDPAHRMFVQSTTNPGLLWPAIIEKAYLKAMGGYNFRGSYSASDTYALTSWIPEYVYLNGYFEESPTSSRQSLWDKVYKNFHEGHLIACVGTGSMSTKQASSLGLIPDHDYSILDLKEIADPITGTVRNIALIKNPWMDSDNSRVASFLSLSQDNSPPCPKGSFWITFESICLRFNSLYLNWDPELFPHSKSFDFLWNTDSLKTYFDTQLLSANPQSKITNTSVHENVVWCLVNEHFSETGSINGYIALTLYDGEGKRVYASNEYAVIKSGPFLNTSQYLFKIQMPPKKSYSLVMTASEKVSKFSSMRFTLKAYSVFPVELEKAEEYPPYKQIIDDSWSLGTCGGTWTYQTYLDNPRYLLKVPEKTELFQIILCSPSKQPINMRMFMDNDIYSRNLQKKREVANSGEYRVGLTALKLTQLNPGEYTIVTSLYEPGNIGSFQLVCRSSSPSFELTRLPSIDSGLYHRHSIFKWNESSRVEIPFSVHIQSLAYFHVIALPEEETHLEHPEIMSFYRPHIRFSVFDKFTGEMLQSNNKYSDDRLGIYLDEIQLKSDNVYVLLVERMECGNGRFKVEAFSQSPVIM